MASSIAAFLVISTSLVLASCSVTIDFGNTQFSCEQTQECPGDQTCLRGVCGFEVPTDASPPADAAAEQDAAPLPFECPSDCAELSSSAETCFCGDALSWDEARANCETTGLDLVRVDTAVRSAELRMVVQVEEAGMLWLAGQDTNVEGTWVWPGGDVFWVGDLDGAAPAGVFADWLPQEPNDTGGQEDCMGTVSAGWNDAPCITSLPYVCER